VLSSPSGRPAPRAALALALALSAGAAVLSVPAPGLAQGRTYVWTPLGYDPPLGLRPVEPATEVGAEIANPFFGQNHFSFVTRPYFGFRFHAPWELYFTIPVTLSSYPDSWYAALGNIEVMASHRIDFGPHFRFAIAFGGFVPSPSCFNFDIRDVGCQMRYDGLWSTGGYMPGYYTPGHVVGHFRLGFAWNPGRGIFTLSWEIGNEVRVRVADARYYDRPADASFFAGIHFGFRVHRVLSLGGAVRFYDWFTQGNNAFPPGEAAYWQGAWSGLFGLRFHAGAFEPGLGVLFMAPGPFVPSANWNGGATVFADLRARWY
jgi:hypothetical protein